MEKIDNLDNKYGMNGFIQVIETYENGVKTDVKVRVGSRTLEFLTSLEPVLVFYTPPVKPGRIRSLSREMRSISYKEFNRLHIPFINKLKVKGLKRLNTYRKTLTKKGE